MNNTIRTDGNATKMDLKTKIMEIRLNTMICPAVMLANKRTIRAKGFVKRLMISTGIIIGASQTGTPGVLKICFQ